MGRTRSRSVTATVAGGHAELRPDPDRPNAWTLLVDGVPQSHVDLDDPTHLQFEYVRRIAHVIDTAAPPGRPLRVLHLGGGALTLPRYVAATRPGSHQQVVDVDPDLVDLVRTHLPLPRTDRPRIRVDDARASLTRTPTASVDLIICDAFTGARTPAHLTTVEFAAEAARALRPTGRHVVNIADSPPLAFTRRQVATLRTAFTHLCLLGDAAVLRGRRYGNLVLVAGAQPPPLAALTRAAARDTFPGRVEDDDDLTRFTGGARPVHDATAEPSPPPPPALFVRATARHDRTG